MKYKKINKADQINHLYILAVNSVKTKGVLSSQEEIFNLISSVVAKKNSIEPLHTSYDIQSQTYLKIIDWLTSGKRGQSLSIESILSPHHIRKTASSFGFSGAKYPAPVCRLEDWSPVENMSQAPSPEPSSQLLKTWLLFSYKLDSTAKSAIFGYGLSTPG